MTQPKRLSGGVFQTIRETQPHPLAIFSNLKTACTILTCFLPLVIQSIRSIIEATIKRKTTAHVMMLWKYKLLNQKMLFNPRCFQDHSGNSADRLPTRCYYNLLPTTGLVWKWSLGKTIIFHSWGPHKFPNSSQPTLIDAPTQHEAARLISAHNTNNRL
jgi:hypothetical protein